MTAALVQPDSQIDRVAEEPEQASIVDLAAPIDPAATSEALEKNVQLADLAEMPADIEVVDEQPSDLIEVTEVEPPANLPGDPTPTLPVDTLPALRGALLQRIENSSNLPRGLRGRLTSALQESQLVDQEGQLLAPVDLLVGVIEQWAPTALRLDSRSLRQGDHPFGDAFFTGDPASVSDEQAERIARQQLQRSGYLPRGNGS